MAKYDDVHENIGEIFVSELFSSIDNENIISDELFKRKLVNKFIEAINELQEAMDSINSLKTK